MSLSVSGWPTNAPKQTLKLLASRLYDWLAMRRRVKVQELLPQDLKLEVQQLAQDTAIDSGTYVAPEALPQTVTCIINGTAGSHSAVAVKRVVELFKARGCEVRGVLAEEGSQIPDLVREAIEEGSTVIVAAGGDGTVNAVASVLTGSSVTLGVLPLGTLNHFAKDVGVPLDLEDAVENVIAGRVVRVDVGTVNGKIFLNNSSLGLYPAIVRQREGLQRTGHGKFWAFAVATFQVLRRYQRLYVKWQIGNQPEVGEETPFVFIGNNHYELSGFEMGQRKCMDAGRLWVYQAPRANRATLFRLALQALRGKQDTSVLKVFSVEKFCIRTQKNRAQVATDGEVHTVRGPLNYGILPKALSVIVPAETSACKPS